MFNPLDFIKIAEELKINVDNEGKIRTAVGRAYYGTFLFAREWLGTKGKIFHKNYSIHTQVEEGLIHYKGRKVGDKYSRLRRLRNKADYNLTTIPITDTERMINKALILADEVIKNCQP